MEIKLLKKIGSYKNKNKRIYDYYQTEHGIVKCDRVYLEKGHKTTINCAVNKITFLENYLIKKYKKNIRILSKSYKNNNSKILITIDGFKYEVFVNNIQNKLPNILSCLDKDEYIVSKLNKTHSNQYIYPNFKYIDIKSKIKIKCLIHGEFEQELKSHLKGSGCLLCAHAKLSLQRITYTKGIENAIIYCIKMKEIDGTIFYKIGFTRHSVEYRFKNKSSKTIRMPYEYEIIYEKVVPYHEACIEERKIHKQLSKLHYVPKIKFDGSATECFTNYKL